MMIMLLAFCFMLLVVAAMSVGVLMGRKPIAGSCGGLSAIGLKSSCDICGGKDKDCEKKKLRKRTDVDGGQINRTDFLATSNQNNRDNS